MSNAALYHQDVIHGFYYDHQMNNPLTMVSLHANARPYRISETVEGEKEERVEWKSASDSNTINCGNDMITLASKCRNRHYDKEWDMFFTSGYSGDNKGEPGDGVLPETCIGEHSKYFAEPICTSLFTEDFSFSVNNDWGAVDNGNAIESAFNAMKPYAPYADFFGNKLSKAAGSLTDQLGPFTDMLNSGAQTLGKGLQFAAGQLDKALYIQGTRYSQYQGSSLHFNNMSMKFTLLSDWKDIWPGASYAGVREYPRFMSVYEQLNLIYPYFIGFYEQNQGGMGKLTQKAISNKNVREPIDKFIDEYVGWQAPPGGFRSIHKNIDVLQKGTLRLVLGSYYTMDNLVIKSMNVNFSRQLVKVPPQMDIEWKEGSTPDNRFGGMVPMYAEVQLELQPAAVATDVKLGRFLNNAGMAEMHASVKDFTHRIKEKGEETNGKTSK